MTKHIILCYSKTGNSKFIAEKLSQELSCDLRMVHPILNYTGILFLTSLLNISVPTNISTHDIKDYEEIIIIGPVWGGLLISPLRTILKKAIALSKPIHFAVTCGTSETDKDKAYGYARVLTSIMQLGGQWVVSTATFSTSLIKEYEGKIKTDITVKPKMSKEN